MELLRRGLATPLRVGLAAGERGLGAALQVVRGVRRALDRSDAAPATPLSSGSDRPATTGTRPGVPDAEPIAPDAVSPSPSAEPMARRPTPAGAKEVDVGAERVAEFGERGAEQDAGAAVHVEPPWPGYDDMPARAIADRLIAADQETVAAVSLYEHSRRDRSTVTRAADRRLRQLSAGA